MTIRIVFAAAVALFTFLATGTAVAQTPPHQGKFEQLHELLPTPNVYRTGSGAPGEAYWQQRADYVIACEVDDTNQRLTGSETITYHNNSPHVLDYLWLQLDQNVRANDSDTYKTETGALPSRVNRNTVAKLQGFPDFDGGHKIQSVTDAQGNDLDYTVVKTMMRIDLPEALQPGEKTSFSIDWYYNINDRNEDFARGGYEYFPEDGNYLYTITQWFPRMAVYDDVNGWQHKQFLGNGEFALEFGNYDVKITVPADFLVASTGTLQNPDEVLSEEEQERLEQSKTAERPVMIRSRKEAEAVQKKPNRREKKTWHYVAEDVRDFAFGASRKYIWDAMGVELGGKTVMAMSYYPPVAEPLYAKYSTEVVAHTLRVYSRMTFDYPYPKAISVEAANGMEYPMICFNYGRPLPDGTYSSRVKYGMIGVIIHEVGHNFFPMIVSSDERQWTWMDEGLNSFVQFVAQHEWDKDFPHRRGPAANIVPYMKGDRSNMTPIMTNSESIPQFGNNAYGKPATALNILRETVMGRELFDHAFRTYSQRWMFKHPEPADFFRSMEDASGMDLDWFWRGWFYTTEPVDIAITDLRLNTISTSDPRVEGPLQRTADQQQKAHISQLVDEDVDMEVDKKEYLRDFYNSYDPFEPTKDEVAQYQAYFRSLSAEEKALIAAKLYLYEADFENVGGTIMPIILRWTYADGTEEVERIPAEVWRKNAGNITKVFVKTKEVTQVEVDPFQETADVDRNNNFFPQRIEPTRFELFKERYYQRGMSGPNPMQEE